jgi:hypothetical protein
MPRVPTHTFSMHGGAGAILSAGLLRRIPLPWFEECVTSTYSTGGDAIISICLWQARSGCFVTAPAAAAHALHDPLADTRSHPAGVESECTLFLNSVGDKAMQSV